MKLVKKTDSFEKILFFERFVRNNYDSIDKAKFQQLGFAFGTLFGFAFADPILIVLGLIAMSYHLFTRFQKFKDEKINKTERDVTIMTCEYIIGLIAGVACSGVVAVIKHIYPFLTSELIMLCVEFVIFMAAVVIFIFKNKINFKNITLKETLENLSWGFICALGPELFSWPFYFLMTMYCAYLILKE